MKWEYNEYDMGYIAVFYTKEIKDICEVEEIIKRMLETSMYKEQIKIIQIPYASLLNNKGEDDGK